jgi:hypothetical protein
MSSASASTSSISVNAGGNSDAAVTNAAATVIQSQVRGALARSSSSSPPPGVGEGAGSDAARQLQKQAYQKLQEQKAQRQAGSRDAKRIRAHESREEAAEVDRVRREKLAAAMSKNEERRATMTAQEVNEMLVSRATDDARLRIGLIKRKVLAQTYGVAPRVYLDKMFKKVRGLRVCVPACAACRRREYSMACGRAGRRGGRPQQGRSAPTARARW